MLCTGLVSEAQGNTSEVSSKASQTVKFDFAGSQFLM
jgi:hypothetical protein